jgi:hypothetical protein
LGITGIPAIYGDDLGMVYDIGFTTRSITGSFVDGSKPLNISNPVTRLMVMKAPKPSLQ